MSITEIAPQKQRQALPRLPRFNRYTWTVLIALVIYTVLSVVILKEFGAVPRFRIDFTPFLTTSFAVQVHIITAIMTFAIGLVLLFAPKGFRLHKTLGWTWVVTMALTAGSSFFISSFSQTYFSPIHAISAWTMLGLPFGIAAIKRKDVAKHRKNMTGMFVGGMLIAGLFSFLPGRLMWHMFFVA